jgi:hypothetical protein
MSGTQTACLLRVRGTSPLRRKASGFLTSRPAPGRARTLSEPPVSKIPLVPPAATAETHRLLALGLASAGLSSTGKGATSVHYRTPVEVAASVFEIQARDPHHFPTTSDVYRFNDRVGLDVLQRGLSLPTTLAALDAVHAVRDNNVTRSRGDEVIAETMIAVLDLVTRGPRGEAEALVLVDRVRRELDTLPSAFWRTEFLDQLERKVLPLFPAHGEARKSNVIRIPLFKNLYRDDEEAARFA